MFSLAEILQLAKPIAEQASVLLMEYYQSPQNIRIMPKGLGDVTNADLAVNEFLLTQLPQVFGRADFAYISEETADDPQRLNYEWVWVIDPLDGTSGFIQRDGQFAIHIGLVYRHRPVLGLVAMPAQQQLYWAIAGGGAFVDRAGSTRPIQVSERRNLAEMTAIISKSHRTPPMDAVLKLLPKKAEINIGSLGGKWTAIASGQADYYITIPADSAPKDWDFCAPELVLQEAGGKATYFDGSPLQYNRPDLSQTQPIVASNGHAHAALVELCQKGWQGWQNANP